MGVAVKEEKSCDNCGFAKDYLKTNAQIQSGQSGWINIKSLSGPIGPTDYINCYDYRHYKDLLFCSTACAINFLRTQRFLDVLHKDQSQLF